MALIQGEQQIYHRCLEIYSEVLKKAKKKYLIKCLKELVNNH